MSILKSRMAGTVGAGVLVAATALAGPLAAPALAATAPTCVDFTTTASGITKTTKIVNNCSSTVRVKLILNFHVDGDCDSLRSGGWVQYTYPRTASVDTVETC